MSLNPQLSTLEKLQIIRRDVTEAFERRCARVGAEEELARRPRIMVVSKQVAQADILSVIQEGERLFGESYVQEVTSKWGSPPLSGHRVDIELHLIGRLQRNKVREVITFADVFRSVVFHSVDRLELLREINKEAERVDKTVQAYLQVNISDEPTKAGFQEAELLKVLSVIESFPQIEITGLMSLGTYPETEALREIAREEFRTMKALHGEVERVLKGKYADEPQIALSMGTSDNYIDAVEEGATIVRIGTALFGERQ